MHTRHYRCRLPKHNDQIGCLVCQLYTEIDQLDQELEDYKAANRELQFKAGIAQAEIEGYVRRHDADRRRIVELETWLSNMAARAYDNSFATWMFEQAPKADHE